jgi:hypothetical protein
MASKLDCKMASPVPTKVPVNRELRLIAIFVGAIFFILLIWVCIKISNESEAKAAKSQSDWEDLQRKVHDLTGK